MEELLNKRCSTSFEVIEIQLFSCHVDVPHQKMKPNPSSTRAWAHKSLSGFINFYQFLNVPLREFWKHTNIEHPSLKKSHLAPMHPNQDLVVFPNRGIHLLSRNFKNFDAEWLSAEIKGDCDLVFGISVQRQRFPHFSVWDFFFFCCFQISMLLCPSTPCSINRRNTWNQIWAA